VPGDALYGIKRLHESARLLPMSGEAEGLARLDLARERLDEVEVLVSRGVTEDALYFGALSDMDDLTTSGTAVLLQIYRQTRDVALADTVRDFTQSQIEGLTALIDRLPPGVVPRAEDSLRIVERAATELVRTLIACGSCPADPFFTSPAARVGAASPNATCACELAGGSTPDGTGGTGGGSGNDDPSTGGNGGNGGNGGTGDDPSTDLPDELPDEIEDPLEDIIDDIIDDLDPLPTPSPSPTLPPLPLPTNSPLPELPGL